MGNSASVKRQPKCTTIGVSSLGSTTAPTTTYDFASDDDERRITERIEEQARWLRMVVEKEKAEKEWLMARFQHAERELDARNEEILKLRGELGELRGTASVVNSAPVQPDTATGDGLEKSPERRISSLKDRRGLHLSVQTNKQPVTRAVTPKSAEDVGPPPQGQTQALRSRADSHGSSGSESGATVVAAPGKEKPQAPQLHEAPKMDLAARKQEFLKNLSQPHQLAVEPMTACAVMRSKSTNGWLSSEDDCMSPLLKRRWEGGRVGLGRSISASMAETKQMLIETHKIQKMDDVPATPKRVPMTPATARRMKDQLWSSIPETLDE